MSRVETDRAAGSIDDILRDATRAKVMLDYLPGRLIAYGLDGSYFAVLMPSCVMKSRHRLKSVCIVANISLRVPTTGSIP